MNLIIIGVDKNMSRIFANMSEAINEIERDIAEMGIQVHSNSMQNKNVTDDPNFDTLELQNYTFSILDMSDKDNCIENQEWCKNEFNERIYKGIVNPGDAWKLRANVWEPFLNETEQFDYTYNERINAIGQLECVIRELQRNPDSRQAVITIYTVSDCINFGGKSRIPCSMYYQFLIRNEKIDVIYNMRSSDFDTHFKNDIWLADELRNYIGKQINVQSGKFMMNVGSLHRYRNYTKHVF